MAPHMHTTNSNPAQGRRQSCLCFILFAAPVVCFFMDGGRTSSAFVGTCSPSSATCRRQSLPRGLSLSGLSEGTEGRDQLRPELPNSTEAMCRQAAAAVMRAYTDGYTRQTVRLRLDAAYTGEDLGALLKASLPLAKSFAASICIRQTF